MLKKVEHILGLKNPYPNSIILYEYLISIIIAISVWAYYTIKLGIFSYNLAKKYNFSLAGLTKSHTFFGPYRDFSDYQWRYFRSNLNIILIFALSFITVSQLIKQKLKSLSMLKAFYLITGVSFTYYLHGNKIIFLYITLTISYILKLSYHKLGNTLYILLTWLFTIFIKITSEIYNGYNLKYIGLGWLSNKEVMAWNVSFGLNMLRIISFNIEYKNEITNDTLSIHDTKAKDHCIECAKGKYCLRYLKFVKCAKDNFTFINFIMYVLYPPLYLAGPIVLFNSFIFQVNNFLNNNHNTIINNIHKIKYTLRCIFDYIFFEVFNHYIYVNCFLTNHYNKFILDNDKQNFDYFYLALLSFNNLTFLWLKFMVIWRIARVWAWYDGILTEENMNRCVYNNYCFEEFWRAWHRSYNVWLIRYIYIPLGGKDKKLFNMWIVFSFVALWHDLKLNLLIWGWFICFFLVPEITVKVYFSKDKMNHLHSKFYFRMIKYMFCSLYIMLMIVANLIGFGMGSEGVSEITLKILKMTSPLYFGKILVFLIPSTITMFYIRDKERVKLGNDKIKF